MPVNRLAGNARAITFDRMTTAATEVGHRRAGPQPLGQPFDERQNDVDQRGVEHLAARLRHQRVESRIFGVGQAAAVVKAADDFLLHLAEQRDELGDPRKVVRTGRPRQQRGALWAGAGTAPLPGRTPRPALPSCRPTIPAHTVR